LFFHSFSIIYYFAGGDDYLRGGQAQHTYVKTYGGGNEHVAPLHPVTIDGQPIIRTAAELARMLHDSVANKEGNLTMIRYRVVADCMSFREAKATGLLIGNNDVQRDAYYVKILLIIGNWELKVGKNGSWDEEQKEAHRLAVEAGIAASTGYDTAAEYFASAKHVDASEAGIAASTGYDTAAEYFASDEFAAACEAGRDKWKLRNPDGGTYLNIFF